MGYQTAALSALCHELVLNQPVEFVSWQVCTFHRSTAGSITSKQTACCCNPAVFMMTFALYAFFALLYLWFKLCLFLHVGGDLRHINRKKRALCAAGTHMHFTQNDCRTKSPAPKGGVAGILPSGWCGCRQGRIAPCKLSSPCRWFPTSPSAC
jgi:hypothetical protein